MVSTFHGIEVGKRALQTSQANISTTGHNIANVNTEGYSRQQVNVHASSSVKYPTNGINPGQLGNGVSIQSITRVRDQYLDRLYRAQVATQGEWEVRQQTLGLLESAINEPSDTGLAAIMNEFWGAWEDLANDPDSLAARAVIKERAQQFVETAKTIDKSMSDIKTQLESMFDAKVTEADKYLEQIADLNQSIKIHGKHANDLKDQVDAVVDKLSKIVHVNVSEQADGTYHVSVADGTTLVNSEGKAGDIRDLTDFPHGELKGIQDSIKDVTEYQKNFNDLIYGLIFGEITVEIPAGSKLGENIVSAPTEITVSGLNVLSQLGFSLREDENEPKKGVPLFNADQSNFSIQSLKLNEEIDKDPGLIAASLRTETINGEEKVVKGNSDLAKLIASLQDKEMKIGEETVNPNEYYQAFISGLGADSKAAMSHVANQEAVLQATQNRRQSITGVSLDEEMANLIKFQHAYNAAARIVSVTDEILDTLINRMA